MTSFTATYITRGDKVKLIEPIEFDTLREVANTENALTKGRLRARELSSRLVSIKQEKGN